MEKQRNIKIDWKTLETREGANLPHWICERSVYHVSFRLADAIPQAKRNQWFGERRRILENAKAMGRNLTDIENRQLRYLFSEKIESYLDAGHGECLLSRPQIGKMVEKAVKHFDEYRYSIHAYCVMPNHVHVIVEPLAAFKLEEIVHSWKSYSSKLANKMLNRTGTFWQSEPYDHLIRSLKEYRFQVEYVWSNPGNLKSGFLRWRKS